VSSPDLGRLGGLEWTRRTGGRMARRERGRLLAAIALGQWENVIGRAKLRMGTLPPGAADVDLETFVVSDSLLVRHAVEACDEQPPELISHAHRTWLFGCALAAVDGQALDPELFYCGALLHDYGLIEPTSGRDFTLAGPIAPAPALRPRASMTTSPRSWRTPSASTRRPA